MFILVQGLEFYHFVTRYLQSQKNCELELFRKQKQLVFVCVCARIN